MQPKKWAQFAGGGFSWTEYSRRAGNFFCMGRQFDGPTSVRKQTNNNDNRLVVRILFVMNYLIIFEHFLLNCFPCEIMKPMSISQLYTTLPPLNPARNPENPRNPAECSTFVSKFVLLLAARWKKELFLRKKGRKPRPNHKKVQLLMGKMAYCDQTTQETNKNKHRRPRSACKQQQQTRQNRTQ